MGFSRFPFSIPAFFLFASFQIPFAFKKPNQKKLSINKKALNRRILFSFPCLSVSVAGNVEECASVGECQCASGGG